MPTLEHAQPSASALATKILDAVSARDESTLRALALDEPEFRAAVWPSLPAARPERNLPFSYVWGELRQKSVASLGATLAAHAGKRYELKDVRFSGPAAEYAGFRLHRDTALIVRSPGAGDRELRLCGSFIEMNGAWKVFSYVVDD